MEEDEEKRKETKTLTWQERFMEEMVEKEERKGKSKKG